MLLHVRLLFHHHASRTVFWDKNCSFTWCHFFFFIAFIQCIFIGYHVCLRHWARYWGQGLLRVYLPGAELWEWALRRAILCHDAQVDKCVKWKVMKKAFDAKTAGGVVHCSVWELSASLVFLSLLLTQCLNNKQEYLSLHLQGMRETKILLATTKTRWHGPSRTIPGPVNKGRCLSRLKLGWWDRLW